MILGDFEDGKQQPMEGGCLEIEILAREWPESGRKTPLQGWGAAGHVKREGGEKREKALKFISCKALKNTWM